MQKAKIIRLAALLLAVFSLAGCGGEQLTLQDMTATVYDHPTNGAELTLPADWQMLSENDEETVFADADNRISLGVARELGGFSYYSADGLAGLAEEVIGSVLSEAEILERRQLGKPENAVLVTAAGKLADSEDEAVCQVVVISPLSAVRYFVIVTAESDAFEEYQQVLCDVYATFMLNKTEDEIYAQLADVQ